MAEHGCSCADVQWGDQGIIEVRLHTGGGPLVWNEPAHRELPELFGSIAGDPDVRVMILTGTGDSFCSDIDHPSFRAGPPGWQKTYWEATRLLDNLMAIEAPIVGAVNGPATYHAELGVLSDIVICSDNTVFQDAPHFPNGAVPGDGVHVVWPEVLGPNRGRYFLLTGHEISAQEARDLGVVSEVVPRAELLLRAHALAQELAKRPTLTLRYTRKTFALRWRRLLLDELSHGLLLEGGARMGRDLAGD